MRKAILGALATLAIGADGVMLLTDEEVELKYGVCELQWLDKEEELRGVVFLKQTMDYPA